MERMGQPQVFWEKWAWIGSVGIESMALLSALSMMMVDQGWKGWAQPPALSEERSREGRSIVLGPKGITLVFPTMSLSYYLLWRSCLQASMGMGGIFKLLN